MAVSREIMSIMAGIEALAEPRPQAARLLPGKSATARIEAMLRTINGTVLPRRLVFRCDGADRMALLARSGRLIFVEGGAMQALEQMAAALVGHARLDGVHRFEVHLAEDTDAAVGVSTADLRAACLAALRQAESEDSGDFATRMDALSLASARLDAAGGLDDRRGDSDRLPGPNDAPLVSAVAAVRAAMRHLGGEGFLAVGAGEGEASRLFLVPEGGEARIGVTHPGKQDRLIRAWAETRRPDSA